MLGRRPAVPSAMQGLRAVLAAGLALGATATGAEVYDVTDFGDTGQPGQLRSLISIVNGGPGDDLIRIGPGTVTLALGSAGDDANAGGDLDLLKSVSIQGAGADLTVIDGGGLDRVIHVQPSVIVALNGLTIRNAAPGGAAVRQESGAGGALTLTNVVVRDNLGTGLLHDGILTMTGGAIVGNGGVGLISSGPFPSPSVLTNVTISGNAGQSDAGGITTDSTLTLRSVTVSDNTADPAGGFPDAAGGLRVLGGAVVTLQNTILAGNRTGPAGTPADCSGTVISAGHNLIQAGCTVVGVTAGNVLGQPAGLAPLGLNAVGTPTHALLPGSRALDAGDASCPPTDQRGVLRPQGPACDIGAFERGPAPAVLDFDGDRVPDIVVGAGRGGEPRVRVLSGAGLAELLSFVAYDVPFQGGVHVAACDLTGDGVPDIVTAPGVGPPLIRVFDGTSGSPLPPPLGGFLAFASGPRTLGATIGCADVTGDGVPDVLVGTGPGVPGRVHIFSGVDASPAGQADAFPGFLGGVSVGP